MESPHPKLATTARDFFLYLLGVGTLYVSVWQFLSLIFDYINVSFPDNVERSGYDYYPPPEYLFHSIRSAMAALIIVFPIYLGITWFLRKDIITHPEKRWLWIRRWLLNLTLFLAAVMIIVDLVTLVNNFLQGELTVRFVLKVLTVFVTAAAVFGYYLWDLKRETTSESRPSWLLAVLALLVVFGSIAGGFFIIGSPGTQRLRRFDNDRVMHLQQLQSEVINYWQFKHVFPPSFDALKSPLTGFAPPVDPETGMSYGYSIKGPLTFELCADFVLPSPDPKEGDYTLESKPIPLSGAPYSNWNWLHPKGRHCFERTIDTDLYPPQPEKPVMRSDAL